MKTRIALAQLNVAVGDSASNVDTARAAHGDGAYRLVALALALFGCLPKATLSRFAFDVAAADALTELAVRLTSHDGFAARIGHPSCLPSVDGKANGLIGHGALVDTHDAASLIVVGGAIVEEAAAVARRVGIRHGEIAIAPMVDAVRASLAIEFAGRDEVAIDASMQARTRGTLSMALSNRVDSIVLTMGNRNELAWRRRVIWRDGEWIRGGQGHREGTRLSPLLLSERGDRIGPDRHDACVHPDSRTVGGMARAPGRPRPSAAVRHARRGHAGRDGGEPAVGGARRDGSRRSRCVVCRTIHQNQRLQATPGADWRSHRTFGRSWRYPITSRFIERID